MGYPDIWRMVVSEKKDLAKLAAENISFDLQGRKGVGDEWDMIDEDIQDEIIEEWTNIIIGICYE